MYRAFINCDIYQSKDQAFLIDDGFFIRTGTNEEIESECSAQDEVIDLRGAFVIPGFVDGGLHLLEIGKKQTAFKLSGTSREQAALQLSHAKDKVENGWLASEAEDRFFEGPECMDRTFLDPLFQETAVCLFSKDQKQVLANSAALKLVQIKAKDEASDLSRGILKGEDAEEMLASLPSPSEKEIESWILLGAEEAAKNGIVMAGSDDFLSVKAERGTVLDAFMQLSYQQKLPVRVNEACRFATPEDFASFLDEGYTTGVGDERFMIGPLYVSSRMLDQMDEDTLQAVLSLAASYNMPALLQGTSSKEIDRALLILQSHMLENNPLHEALACTIPLSEKQLDEISRSHLEVLYEIGRMPIETVKNLKHVNEKAELLFASGAPDGSLNILNAIEKAVTSPDGLSVSEALHAWMKNGVQTFFRQDLYGKTAASYAADFAVLDHNLLTMDPHRIAEAKVLMTVVDGETVYEK